MEAGQHHEEDRKDEQDPDGPGCNAGGDVAAAGTEAPAAFTGLLSLSG
jgi:hypothetical protein